MVAMIAITIFVITTDEGGDETVTDQIKDFTALVIIVDIDNMLAGVSRYTYEQLEIQWNEVSLGSKFERYVDYNLKKKNRDCCTKLVEGTINSFIDIT